MDDAFTALDAQDASNLLAGGPFAAALGRGDALVILSGSPLRVAFATHGGLALFGARDRAELDAALLEARAPGIRRLRDLAQSLPPGGAPRMERLRLFSGRLPTTVGLLCGRLAAPEGRTHLVAVAPAAEPSRREPAPQAATAADSAEPLEGAPPLDGPIRFLWILDTDGRFGATDPALVARLGPNAPRTGELLDSLRKRLSIDPSEALAKAIAARRTFSGLRLEWPEPNFARKRVVLMSGTPRFDGERRFTGFRGFGVFTGQGVLPEGPTALAPIPDRPRAETPPLAKLAVPAIPEPSPPVLETPPPVKAAREGGAEIYVLRPPPGGPNVVPIRPGALSLLTPPSAPDPAQREADVVELSSQERDAFREIARALGARIRSPRFERGEPEVIEAVATPQPPERGDAETLLDALPIGALVLREGEAVYLNRTLLDLLGYADILEFRAAGAVKTIFRDRDPATLSANAEIGATPMLAARNERIDVDALARPISWGGKPATLIAVRRSRDAEMRARMRALEDENQRAKTLARDLAAALDVAADGMIRLDESGRVLGMSARAEALFGYDQKEAAGEHFTILLAPASRAAAAARFEAATRDSSDGEGMEVVALGQDGQAIPVRLAFGLLAATPEREYWAVARDLTEAREAVAARDKARRESASKTEFLGRVSHEIRTPLNAILGFAEVMTEERFGPIGNDRYKDYLKDIHASGKHVISLADDLLDMAKIESGKMEFAFAPIDANRVIRECVAMLQPRAARERIIMRLSLFDKLPNIMADERSLRQIMLNLMSNAVKYNEPGGQVIVSTAIDESGHPVIRVRDTGVGMDESELSVALQPFRRVPGGRDDGTGLGLPLAKALVEANHAFFSIKSRKQHGTLVEVAFPGVRAAQ
jgi:PAS domain S-box-containing protein